MALRECERAHLAASAEIGGLIEVVEWVPARELAWTSVTGLDQRGRWLLRDAGGGRTRVELRLAYGVAGAGLTGWLAEHIAAPTVTGHLRRTVRQLKRMVEQANSASGRQPVRPGSPHAARSHGQMSGA